MTDEKPERGPLGAVVPTNEKPGWPALAAASWNRRGMASVGRWLVNGSLGFFLAVTAVMIVYAAWFGGPLAPLFGYVGYGLAAAGGATGICLMLVRAMSLRRELRACDYRLCRRCHYPLPLKEGGGTCPECGAAFDVAATVSAWKSGKSDLDPSMESGR